MNRTTLIAVTLCLVLIAAVGAGVVAAKQDSNPRQAGNSSVYLYDVVATDTHGSGKLMINVDQHTFVFNGKDFEPSAIIGLRARAADSTDFRVFASGTATPSGNLHIEGAWTEEIGAEPASPDFVVGLTKVYTATIQHAYSTEPCYTLVYTDTAGTFTIYLPADQITFAEGGHALPSVISTPGAVDYVVIDEYHYTLDFRYQGVYYSAKWATTCPVKSPYIAGDANHCNPPFTDVFFGHVYIYSFDEAGNEVKTPAAGVQVRVFVYDCDPPCGTGELYELGSDSSGVLTDANGKWSWSFPFAPQGHDGYATYYLAGYPVAQDDIDWAGLCIED
jgi:hypothetical protein